MTTTTIDGWEFIHNSGDGRDDCTIVRPSRVGHTMTVPCDVLMKLVAEWVRARKIAALESASTEELLGLEGKQ